MRILWSIHLYPPKHNCGAEYMAHGINTFLIEKGHEARVLLHEGANEQYSFEGVTVFGPRKFRDFSLDAYKWGDVICTHLGYTQHSINMGYFARRPVINFVHNSYPYPPIINARKPQYIVYNSKWLEKEIGYNHSSIVLYPPCELKKYLVVDEPEKNKFVTLININENKGGYLLVNLAKALPHISFLAVIGSYDDGGRRQDILSKLEQLVNVTLIPNTSDIQAVYKKTRILLVPSRNESWGRVATEAMINGIPVIACPTPGLLENCGDAALYIPGREKEIRKEGFDDIITCDEDYDITEMATHIINLFQRDVYLKQSKKSLLRAIELEDIRQKQLNNFENFIQDAAKNYKH